MDFSIIIPVLNEEVRLPKCLESIRNLDYPKDQYEVIVVDNGSTDKSVDIVKEFGFISILESNRGITHSRQKGLELTNGTYYITTDADAIVPPDWLKNAKKAFEKDPRIVAITGPSFAYDAGKFGKYFMGWASYMLGILSGSKTVMGCNMAFKTDALKQVGGFLFKNFRFYEDAIISVKMARVGKILIDWNFYNSVSARRYKGIKAFNIFKNVINYFTLKYFGKIYWDKWKHGDTSPKEIIKEHLGEVVSKIKI